MNTSTPEQLQEFKDFYVKLITKECGSEKGQLLLRYHDDWWLMVYRNNTAYANHVLMKQEDIVLKFGFGEAMADVIEVPVDEYKEAVRQLRKLAALQEMFNKTLHEYAQENIDIKQQLTEARKEIEGLKAKIQQGHKTYKDNTPTA